MPWRTRISSHESWVVIVSIFLEGDVSTSRRFGVAETLLIQFRHNSGCRQCLLQCISHWYPLPQHSQLHSGNWISHSWTSNCLKTKATAFEPNQLLLLGKGKIDFIYLQSNLSGLESFCFHILFTSTNGKLKTPVISKHHSSSVVTINWVREGNHCAFWHSVCPAWLPFRDLPLALPRD